MRNLPYFIGLAVILLASPAFSAPRISEFMAANDATLADVDGDFSDWIEIHNPDATAVDLAGYHLTDDALDLTRWTFPSITIPSGGRLIIFASNKDRTDPAAELHTDFQLSASGEYLALVAPDGTTVLTEFAPLFPPQSDDQSYGNSSFGDVSAASLVAGDATGSYHVPADGSLGTTWTTATFDDSAWTSGTSGFGWETPGSTLEPLIGTDIRDAMRGVNGSGYFRFPFEFDASASSVQSLLLTVQADDGFVAYLNGIEIARDRAPTPALWNSLASGSISDATNLNNPIQYDASAFAHLVTDGTNVLAVHGMGAGSAGGSDFVIRPVLDATVEATGNAVRAGYYDTPTPGTPDSGGTTAGPIFTAITDKPDRPFADADLVITAKLEGVNAPAASVLIFYRVMYGAEVQVDMTDDGTGDDEVAGDSIYTATIPASAYDAGEMIRWRFFATDSLGFTTKEPRFLSPIDSHEYVGTVAADPDVLSKLTVVEFFMPNITSAGNISGTRGAVFYLGELYDNIFMNRHGQSTGGFPKKSYNLDFNKTQRFRWHPDEKRVKDIDLLTNWADKSKVRHALSWEIMRESGVHAHFAFTVRVQNDGEFWSTADFVEDADDIYLERAGLNPDGALYKIYDNRLNAGDSPNSPAAEKKNRRDEGTADFAAFIAGLNTGTAEQQWDFIYDNVNLPMCVNLAAANCVVRNTDMHRKNWYIYRDTGVSDEWAILPWDLDLAHGRLWNSAENYFDHDLHTTGVTRVGNAVRLVNMMWSRPDTRDMMQRRIRTLTDRFLNPADTPVSQRWFERRLDEQSALIDPPEIVPSDARLDFEKWGSWIEGSSAQVPYTSTHPHVEDMSEGIARFRDEYLPGRRTSMYSSGDMAGPQSGGISITFQPLVELGATSTTRVPSDSSDDATWMTPGFDDSAWAIGTTGIGYDSSKYLPLIGTDTNAEMRNINATSYTRIEFDVADPSLFAALELRMKYDDGFVAYLNGVEVAQANAPATLAFNSNATTASQEALVDQFEIFDISDRLDLLTAGTNVLAMHGMNGSTGSSDYLMLPELHAGVASDASPEPTIDFGTIEFKPASNDQDEEFVELLNNNAIAVDVSDWIVSGGIDFEIPPGTVIPAGGTLYLSPSTKAFRARAVSPRGGEQNFVVGPYSGHLSNLGETLTLTDHNGALNNNTSYAGAPSDAQSYLVISEVMYHPEPNGLAEYVEILNISDTVTLDLTGVHFTDAFDFDFTGSAITLLAPGARALVVRDLAEFEAEHGAGLPVAGEFANGTALSNGGEEIKFEDAENGTIREFRYNDKDPWPLAADGGGSSLVLIDPLSAPDHTLAESWRAGAPRPGLDDPSGFTGDPDADLDGDGLSAFLEYALGTADSDPASGQDALLPSSDAGSATFSYRRNTAAVELSFTVETSSDGEIWQSGAAAGLTEISRIDNGDGSETVTVRHPEPLSSVERQVFRLRISQ